MSKVVGPKFFRRPHITHFT